MADSADDHDSGLLSREGDSAGDGFIIAPQRSQRLDWIHRGSREPLASMGFYHYSMFVYSAFQPASNYAPNDFVTYYFADSHPDCASRVQRLRVNERYRVPRVLGFTMPRAGGSKEDTEKNALFKSVLLRPCAASEQLHLLGDQVEPFVSCVGPDGSFVQPWQQWFATQRQLAARCQELQERAGKVFTLQDVDMSIPYLEVPSLTRRVRPSPAEFMANITIGVVMNLDLQAESRVARGFEYKPHANDLLVEDEEGNAFQGDDCGEDEGATSSKKREQISKTWKAKFAIKAEHARALAVGEGLQTDVCTREYIARFQESHGALFGQKSMTPAKPFGFTPFPGGTKTFEETCDMQDKEFAYAQPGATEDNEQNLHGRLRQDPKMESEPAHMARLRTPRDIMKEEIEKLRSRTEKPVDLNRRQLDFLSLATCQLEKLWDALNSSEDDNYEALRNVKPLRIFLGGQGGTGKSEVVRVVRSVTEYFFNQGSVKTLASSNSAARGIDGETFHTGLHTLGENNFRIKSLSQEPTDQCKREWNRVQTLVIEEVSMVEPGMLAGSSYRMCRARRGARPWVDPNLYEHEDHMFGGIPLVIMLGDFMQLAPSTTASSASLLSWNRSIGGVSSSVQVAESSFAV